MRYLMLIIAALVFVPLFLALLFVMPMEFCVSTWHLWRLDAMTEGQVIESEVASQRGNTRSDIRYSYTVNGRVMESDRVRAGWISNKGFESGGGAAANSAPAHSKVTVRYDSSHPEFSLLEYGWPKWSIGFSLAVWGMYLGGLASGKKKRKGSGHLKFGLIRGAQVIGFMTIFFLPPTIEPRVFLYLLGAIAIVALVASSYSRFRYPSAGR